MIPYHISDHTLTFFTPEPHTIADDSPNWKEIRNGVVFGTLSKDELINLADVKVSIQNADTSGLLRFVGDALNYGNHALAGIWVDKILKFREEKLPFDPVFKALESLMRNPSSMARERFPLFAERNKFGFLPDGRMVAFKVVRDNYMDVHTGKFDNHVGKVPAMPRAEVDDDPDRTCSKGFHVGALDYLPNFGMWQSDRRVVLTAFWPEDVVAIPKDYNGSKMRVCTYGVIDDVDKNFVEKFVADRQTIVTGYGDAEPDEDEDEDEDETDSYDEGYHDGEYDAQHGNEPDYGTTGSTDGSAYRKGYVAGYASI